MRNRSTSPASPPRAPGAAPRRTATAGWDPGAGRAGARRQLYRSRTRRRRLLVLALPCAALCTGIALAIGGGPSPSETLALHFAREWAHGEWPAMYAQLDLASRRSLSMSRFASEYQRANVTATVASATIGHHLHTIAGQGSAASVLVAVPARVRTRLFGTLRGALEVPIDSEGGRPRVRFVSSLLFPGLRPGEALHRETALPPRAPLLARDGSVLAEGSPVPGSAAGPRASPLGAAAQAAAGEVGPIPSAERATLEAQGVPANATVGVSGLELAFDARLRGVPGGTLMEGSRVIARAAAHADTPLRTTIVPALQRAAVIALGGQLGGVVALRPQTGEVLAVAGLGIDDVQPPGSTFKMVTVSAVLQAGIANPSTVFPRQTSTLLEGVTLHNAGGELCGGTLAEAFAVSCNSVFAPLGVKLGASRLVAMAERYGFNRPPELPGAVESTLPTASHIGGEMALGSTALGQGEVLASPLQMALVAATIANGGRRAHPGFLPASPRSKSSRAAAGAPKGAAHAAAGEAHAAAGAAGVPAGTASPTGPQVISSHIARTITQLMLGVVHYGTGTAAAIPGLEVAGKTGTAELGGPTCGNGSSPETGRSAEAGAAESCAARERQNTDAWFAAFAPAAHPRIAVAAMLVRDGYGGETAAPVVRQVIEAWRESEPGG
jgi:peptidoglycan glycosyltransferase